MKWAVVVKGWAYRVLGGPYFTRQNTWAKVVLIRFGP